MPDHGGNRTYDLWNTSPMLCQLSYAVRSVRVCDISEQNLVPSITYSNRPDRVALLAEHWASIPKVVGSIPTVVNTLRVTSQASYSPEYITLTQKKLLFVDKQKVPYLYKTTSREFEFLHKSYATAVAMATMKLQDDGYFSFKVI